MRYSGEPAVDHVGDEQLVGGEVVLRLVVIPDVRVTIFLVRSLVGVSPGSDSLFGGRSVPLTITIGKRKILKCGDRHPRPFLRPDAYRHALSVVMLNLLSACVLQATAQKKEAGRKGGKAAAAKS
jgi:hypothetical protein